MGLFDSLVYRCPMCGAENEIQTKSGPCFLDVFKMEEDLPVWLMQDFNNYEEECLKCGKRLKLVFDLKIAVKKKAVEPVDNLDLIELTYRKRMESKKKKK